MKKIDENEVENLINLSIREEKIGDLHILDLCNCGDYINQQFLFFQKDLQRHRDAKSPKKREHTYFQLSKAGRDLSFAVTQMKNRMETEEKEKEYFYVHDNIFRPTSFTNNLSVKIRYKWRHSPEGDWNSGDICFKYQVVSRLYGSEPPSNKKLDKSRHAQQIQKELSDRWDHLMRLSLFSVRDFFRDGGDGKNIPKTFQAVPDQVSGLLNNFSTNFW